MCMPFALTVHIHIPMCIVRLLCIYVHCVLRLIHATVSLSSGFSYTSFWCCVSCTWMRFHVYAWNPIDSWYFVTSCKHELDTTFFCVLSVCRFRLVCFGGAAKNIWLSYIYECACELFTWYAKLWPNFAILRKTLTRINTIDTHRWKFIAIFMR